MATEKKQDALFYLFSACDQTEVIKLLHDMILASRTEAKCQKDQKFIACVTDLLEPKKYDQDLLFFGIFALAIKYRACRLLFCRLGHKAAMEQFIVELQKRMRLFLLAFGTFGEQTEDVRDCYALTPVELAAKVRVLYCKR